jgi:hypothetical protein
LLAAASIVLATEAFIEIISNIRENRNGEMQETWIYLEKPASGGLLIPVG